MGTSQTKLNPVLAAIRLQHPRCINSTSRTAAIMAVAASLSIGTGHAAPMPDTFNPSELDGSNGFTINGVGQGDRSGRSVSAAGDINGDGIDDFIMGASDIDTYGTDSGASYVVFGNTSGFDSSINLAELNGNNGFTINGGAEGDYSGESVSAAGDINGDGIDDLIIGARRVDTNGSNSGASYVVFGKRTAFNSSINLAELNGNDGFTLNGFEKDDYSGKSASAAGDINGDGIDDLIIGAYGVDTNGTYSGASYVVFGNTSGFDSSIDLAELNGNDGFIINGGAEFDQSGRSVSAAGDINGDGIDDLIIGAYGVDTNGYASGASYVVFGNISGFDSSINLADLDSDDGFTINGAEQNDRSGVSVSAAGDINGDGFDDFIIGADGVDTNGSDSGASYVVFGKRTAFNSAINLADLDGNDGFTINGVAPLDGSGGSVSAAGDVNGDGFDDLIIGADGVDTNGSDSGASYVVFGKTSGFDSSIDLATLDGNDGFTINGDAERDYSGRSVSAAGDINGDGIDDLIIGATGVDTSGTNSGASYVVFMPLADPSDASNVLTLGNTVHRSIAPVANTNPAINTDADVDQFFFSIPVDSNNPNAIQQLVIQTSNDGTKIDYDTTLTLFRTNGVNFDCPSDNIFQQIASNDNIDSAPDQAYSRLTVDLTCGFYRIDVASKDPSRAIPSYALSLTTKPVKILPTHQWELISLPDGSLSPDAMTVEAVFADDLPGPLFTAGSNPADADWVMFGYDEITDNYNLLTSTSPLEVGKAYWIRQLTGSPVTLDTPENFTPQVSTCHLPDQDCLTIPMIATSDTTASEPTWNAVGKQGYPSTNTSIMGVVDTFSDCSFDVCNLDEAFNEDLLWNSFYRYDGRDYVRIGGVEIPGLPNPASQIWHPWEGFWSAALLGSVNNDVFLIIPE